MIDGLDDLILKLNNMASDTAVHQALLISAYEVENKAKILCPVGDSAFGDPNPGRLRASITHRIDDVNKEAIVGTNVEYAPYVEYGTGIYAYNGDGRETGWTYRTPDGQYHYTEGQKPQMFLHNALSQSRQKVVNICKGVIIDG